MPKPVPERSNTPVSLDLDDSLTMESLSQSLCSASDRGEELGVTTANSPDLSIYAQPDQWDSMTLLLKAINFACEKHTAQRRKDPEKTPYINHPIGVANILAAEGGITDLKVLQAAVLHDTVEDTETTFEELEEVFGHEVRSIVAEVTDNKCLSYQERKLAQIQKSPHISREAKLVKLADKIHNLRDLLRVNPEGWTDERVRQYFVWSGKVIEGVLGTNALLEESIRKILAQRGVALPRIS